MTTSQQTLFPHRSRLSRCSLILAAWLLAASAQAQTMINPGQSFMLGGEQSYPVRVEGRNTGRVNVDLLVRFEGRDEFVKTVTPGESFDFGLPPKSTAMARNKANERASLRFIFNGQINNLSMGYDRP
jgi:hypothetical protein